MTIKLYCFGESGHSYKAALTLNLMGLDPMGLTYFYAGLDQRLVGVEGAQPIHQIMA